MPVSMYLVEVAAVETVQAARNLRQLACVRESPDLARGDGPRSVCVISVL
jgi:hypothetical protein